MSDTYFENKWTNDLFLRLIEPALAEFDMGLEWFYTLKKSIPYLGARFDPSIHKNSSIKPITLLVDSLGILEVDFQNKTKVKIGNLPPKYQLVFLDRLRQSRYENIVDLNTDSIDIDQCIHSRYDSTVDMKERLSAIYRNSIESLKSDPIDGEVITLEHFLETTIKNALKNPINAIINNKLTDYVPGVVIFDPHNSDFEGDTMNLWMNSVYCNPCYPSQGENVMTNVNSTKASYVVQICKPHDKNGAYVAVFNDLEKVNGNQYIGKIKDDGLIYVLAINAVQPKDDETNFQSTVDLETKYEATLVMSEAMAAFKYSVGNIPVGEIVADKIMTRNMLKEILSMSKEFVKTGKELSILKESIHELKSQYPSDKKTSPLLKLCNDHQIPVIDYAELAPTETGGEVMWTNISMTGSDRIYTVTPEGMTVLILKLTDKLSVALFERISLSRITVSAATN